MKQVKNKDKKSKKRITEKEFAIVYFRVAFYFFVCIDYLTLLFMLESIILYVINN